MEKADKKADYGYTPLHRAVAKGDVEAMKRLLEEKDIDVNTKNTFDSTALHLAVGKGDVVLVKLLLERGASPRIENKQGQTATQLSRFLWNTGDNKSSVRHGTVMALLRDFMIMVKVIKAANITSSLS